MDGIVAVRGLEELSEFSATEQGSIFGGAICRHKVLDEALSGT